MGPVWHISVAGPWPDDALREAALKAIEGVGDAELGEWEEVSPIACHIRRRCTPREERITDGVVDVRGTPEFARRLAIVRRRYPWAPAQ